MKRTNAIHGMATGTLFVTYLILNSCSGGGPREGTPAFLWAAANETFSAADYIKTVQHLEKLSATDNEFTARARPWLLVMTSGMARGYRDLADSFEAGSRTNISSSTPLRRGMNQYRGEANRLSIEFVEVFDKFQKGKDDPVAIAIPPPSGSAAPVAALAKVAAGVMPSPAEIDPMEKQAVVRGVLLAASDAAGATGDTAKAKELLKPGSLTLSRAAFITTMANSLFEASQIYGQRKIDDPEKMKIFCNRALDALKAVPETKETKDLGAKIAKSIKKS